MRPVSPDPLDTSGGIPYEHLAHLRATCPVSQTASGVWYLARHADVLAAAKDVETFHDAVPRGGRGLPGASA
jgi:hypothetical protein